MVPQASSVQSFFQLLGGALGITIPGTVFANSLKSNIAKYAPGLSDQLVTGARQSTSVIFGLPDDLKEQVVVAYVHALDRMFVVGVPTMIASSLCVFLIKNHNLKERGTRGAAVEAI
jgi:hypothetical protein